MEKKYNTVAQFFDLDKMEAEEKAEKEKRFEDAKKLLESCAFDRFYDSSNGVWNWQDLMSALRVAAGLSNLEEEIPSSIQ